MSTVDTTCVFGGPDCLGNQPVNPTATTICANCNIPSPRDMIPLVGADEKRRKALYNKIIAGNTTNQQTIAGNTTNEQIVCAMLDWKSHHNHGWWHRFGPSPQCEVTINTARKICAKCEDYLEHLPSQEGIKLLKANMRRSIVKYKCIFQPDYYRQYNGVRERWWKDKWAPSNPSSSCNAAVKGENYMCTKCFNRIWKDINETRNAGRRQGQITRFYYWFEGDGDTAARLNPEYVLP